jgi:transcription elongation factor GreA-like protein
MRATGELSEETLTLIEQVVGEHLKQAKRGGFVGDLRELKRDLYEEGVLAALEFFSQGRRRGLLEHISRAMRSFRWREEKYYWLMQSEKGLTPFI